MLSQLSKSASYLHFAHLISRVLQDWWLCGFSWLSSVFTSSGMILLPSLCSLLTSRFSSPSGFCQRLSNLLVPGVHLGVASVLWPTSSACGRARQGFPNLLYCSIDEKLHTLSWSCECWREIFRHEVPVLWWSQNLWMVLWGYSEVI